MAARLSSSLRRITVAAHLGLAGCLGWIALAMAGHVLVIDYPDLTLGSCASVAFALILAVVLLSGTGQWLRGGVEFRLVYADLLAVFAAPIALIPAVFTAGVVVLGELVLAMACLVLVLVSSRGRSTAAVGLEVGTLDVGQAGDHALPSADNRCVGR